MSKFFNIQLKKGHHGKRKDTLTSVSNSNLSESFLTSINFKPGKKFGPKIRPAYVGGGHQLTDSESDDDYERKPGGKKGEKNSKRSLSQKRRPIRGQMGTFLPPETLEERRSRLEKENLKKMSKLSKGSTQLDESSDQQEEMRRRASSYNNGLKPIREDMYEIPSHSVMRVGIFFTNIKTR